MNNKKETVFRKLKDNDGIGTIEVVLILIVLIALVLLFKTQILSIAESIVGQISKSVNKVY